MGFVDTIICSLNFFKKNLLSEVENYLENVKEIKKPMTRQAYSKNKANILPAAYTILNDVLVNDVYSKQEYFDKFEDYRLLAVDGSVVSLHNSPEMRKEFHYVSNQSSKYARAQASCIYDVENHVILHSILDKYTTPERSMAIEHLNKLETLGFRNDLILFDRGYPSTNLMGELINKNVHFLMRVAKNFLIQVNEFTEEDGIVKFKYNDKFIELRVLNVILETGEVEKLITNILDKRFSANDFKGLYFKRWGIETRLKFLKSILEIEKFVGETPLGVYQDFYATIYLSNLCEMVKACSDEIIEQENQEKTLKFEYKTNQSRLIEKLKNNLSKLILEDDLTKKQLLFDKILKQITKNSVAIQPGRSYPRKKIGGKDKFPTNKK
jgi:hypothetical protein